MINLEHDDIDVFQYQLSREGIISNLKKFVNNSNKKYILIISDEITLNPNAFKDLVLTDKSADIIELKSLDKDTGNVNYAVNLTGAVRMMKLFPSVEEQDLRDVTPYIPRIVLYKRELLNVVLTHVPINANRLSYGIDYLMEAIMNCDFKVLREVEAINDKVYGDYSKLKCKKVIVSESLMYIDKILFNIGIKSDYYASFVYWSKQEVRNAL